MSEEKSIRIIEFSGKQSDWDGWSEKFLAKAEHKGYRKLLLCKRNTVGYDVIPTESQYEDAEKETSKNADHKMTIALAKLNRQAYMDLILSIDHKSSRGKVAFRLVKNCKSTDYPEGNCKLAWSRLVAKYAPKSTPSLLKLKKRYENSKLTEVIRDPEDWISELEGIRTEIENIDSSAAISDKEFMVKILNNLPSEYDTILDGLENRLTLDPSDSNALTIESIREKLSNRYERIADRDRSELYESEERGLAAYGKQFKGTCNRCGKYGHKGMDCTNNNDSEGNNSRGCFFCGMSNHSVYDCRKLLAIKNAMNLNEKAAMAKEEEDSSDEESMAELGF